MVNRNQDLDGYLNESFSRMCCHLCSCCQAGRVRMHAAGWLSSLSYEKAFIGRHR